VLNPPRVAGETERYAENVVGILVDNVERLLRGETALRNSVVYWHAAVIVCPRRLE
jgi:hypothetical protein